MCGQPERGSLLGLVAKGCQQHLNVLTILATRGQLKPLFSM